MTCNCLLYTSIDLKGMQADSCKYEFVLDNLFFANIDGPEVQKGKVNVVLVVKLSLIHISGDWG